MSEVTETAVAVVPAAQAERQETYLQSVSHVRMGIAPQNLEEGFRLASLLSKSTLVPKDFQGNPGNVMIAIQMGMEVGLAPMQALQSLAVINGRPSLFGDGLLAVVMNDPAFEWIDEPPVVNNVATCTVKRRRWDKPVSRTFSADDAKKAGLWGKAGPWTTYPERMLRMRARAFALRDVFADVLRGLGCGEEQADIEATAVPPRPAIQEVRRLATVAVEAQVDKETGEITPAAPEAPKVEEQAAPVVPPAPTDPRPAPAQHPDPLAGVYSADEIYHLVKVYQPNAAKPYYLFETAEGVTFHAWSTTVIGHAKAALASQIPVRLNADPVNFAVAPWRVTNLDAVMEREAGSDDE